MDFFKKLFVLFFVLGSPSVYSTSLEATIAPEIQKVQVNGAIDVELNSHASSNDYKVTYEGEKESIVTVENKNGILFVQSNGVFHEKPRLKINMVDAPLEYSASGIGESILHIHSENDFNIALNGVSKAKLIGQSDSIHFKLQGTSSIDLLNYSAKDFKGEMEGISSVYIKEKAPLTIQKSGISKVYYK